MGAWTWALIRDRGVGGGGGGEGGGDAGCGKKERGSAVARGLTAEKGSGHTDAGRHGTQLQRQGCGGDAGMGGRRDGHVKVFVWGVA